MRPPAPRRPGGGPKGAPSRAGRSPSRPEGAPPPDDRRPATGNGTGEGGPTGAPPGAAATGARADRGSGRSPRTSPAGRRTGKGDSRAVSRPGADGAGQLAAGRGRPPGAGGAAQVLGPAASATDIDERRRERARAKRRLALTRTASVLGALAAVSLVVWGIFFSPLFALSVSSVRVSGVEGTSVDAARIASAVAAFEGTPITRLDTGRVREAVMADVAVKDAVVSRRWPSGLMIEVTARQGAMYEAVGSSYALVDSEGVAFATADARPAGLPLVSLPEEDRQQAAADVLEAWDALDGSVRQEVESLASDGAQVTIALRGSRTVKWGTRGQAVPKAQVLAALLAQRSASTYDVSVPARPVTS